MRKDILPDNVADLQALVALLQRQNNNLHSQKTELEKEKNIISSKYEESLNEILNLRYRLDRFFSTSKKEKAKIDDKSQPSLFDEAETSCNDATESSEEEPLEESDDEQFQEIKSYKRKKRGGKKPIPDWVSSQEFVSELSDEDRKCDCCGELRPIIGENRSEELDVIPEQIYKRVNIQKKYGPCNCNDFLDSGQKEIVIAEKPKRLIPYSIASSGLIAYTIDQKYNYAMPYFRLSKRFQALDIEISKSTLCNWSLKASEKCKKLYDTMIDYIKSKDAIQMDETRLQVLNEEGKKAESLSYMWIMRNACSEKNLTVFHYSPTRNGDVPLTLLEGFKGYLQTDGYEGYSKVVREYGLYHAGCLTHVRRKFYDADNKSKNSKTCKKAMRYIRQIYNIERELRKQNLPPDDFVKRRKEKVEPILYEFKKFLDEKELHLVPNSNSGEAVSYAIRQWDKVIRYLDHADLTPDNNRIENAIRPFVIGRKNWLFSNTPRGANSSAVLYSLVESAKDNNLKVYNYLRYVFEKLPYAETQEDYEKLLPFNIDPKDLEV